MNSVRLSTSFIPKICILIFAAVLLYAQTLNDPFHFDDAVTIVTNQAVHHLPDLSSTIRGLLEFQPSRFVTNFTFAINYFIGRLDVTGYHAVNILIHLGVAFLVWWFGELLVRLTGRKEGNDNRSTKNKKKKTQEPVQVNAAQASPIPFLAALVFLVHPVNTEAVSYISQRSEQLAALFYLAAVCLYIQGRMLEGNPRLFFAGAVICGLLGSFSKETAVTLPLMIIVVELFFFGGGTKENIRHRRTLFGSLIIAFVLLIPAAFKFDYAGRLFSPHLSQSHLGDVLTLPTYLLTQLNVWVDFLRLAFVPIGLNLDHDYPMAHTLLEFPTLASFGVLAALLAAAFRLRRSHPMVSFAIIWFFVTLASNLVPRAHVIFEHKLYLVLTGMLPALCLGVSALVKDRRAVVFVLFVIILILGTLTFFRNRVWASEVSLWEDVIRKSPNKARVHLSLGTAYAAEGRYEEALKYLTSAIGMMADPYRAYSTRGAVYAKMGRDDLALDDFNKATAAAPQFTEGYVRRAEALARGKAYTLALEEFNKAIATDPHDASAYKMRGRLYDAMRQYGQAFADYNKALGIDPGDAQALAWRGYLHAIAGRIDEALADFNKAIRIDPGFADAYVYRGMYFKDRKDYRRAFAELDKAVALSPKSSLAHYQRAGIWFDVGNLDKAAVDLDRAIALDPGFDLPYALRGIIHARRKEYDEAMRDFNKAIEIDPQSGSHHFNRSKLYRETGNAAQMIMDARAAKSLGFAVPQEYLQ